MPQPTVYPGAHQYAGATPALTLVQINVVAHAFQRRRTQTIKHFLPDSCGRGRAYYACPHELQDVVSRIPLDPDLAFYEQLQIIAHAGVTGLTVRLDADVVCRAGTAAPHGVARPPTVRVSLEAKKQCTLSRASALCGVPLWEWCTAVPTGAAAAAWDRGDCSCPHRHKVRILGFDEPPRPPRLLRLPRLFSTQEQHPQDGPNPSIRTTHPSSSHLHTLAAATSHGAVQSSQSQHISPGQADGRPDPAPALASSMRMRSRMLLDRMPLRILRFSPPGQHKHQHPIASARAPPPPPLQPRSQPSSARTTCDSSSASVLTTDSTELLVDSSPSSPTERSPRVDSAPGPVPCPAPAPEDTHEDRPLTVPIAPPQVLFQPSSYAPFELESPAADLDCPGVEPLKLGPSTCAAAASVPARPAVQPAVAFIPIVYPFRAVLPPLACTPGSRPVSITYQDALSGPADVYIAELENQISSIFDVLYTVSRRR